MTTNAETQTEAPAAPVEAPAEQQGGLLDIESPEPVVEDSPAEEPVVGDAPAATTQEAPAAAPSEPAAPAPQQPQVSQTKSRNCKGDGKRRHRERIVTTWDARPAPMSSN